MQKNIIVINGTGGSGKDTFVEFVSKYTSVVNFSSVDKVKEIARMIGWDGGKTEKDRKFLSDLKLLTTDYSDMPFKEIKKKVEKFMSDKTYEVMLIDIREPEEIERAKTVFGAKAILIENNNVKHISSNMADANVYNYKYDYVIQNNGTLEEFKENIEKFYRSILEEEDGDRK